MCGGVECTDLRRSQMCGASGRHVVSVDMRICLFHATRSLRSRLCICRPTMLDRFLTSVISAHLCIPRHPRCASGSTFVDAMLNRFLTSMISENLCVQRDPVAALPALHLSTHDVETLRNAVCAGASHTLSHSKSCILARIASHIVYLIVLTRLRSASRNANSTNS